jgi:hypothetical protein
MRVLRLLAFGVFAALGSVALAQYQPLRDRNEVLLRQVQTVHGYTDAQMAALRKIFANSGYMGQGNPAITEHPVTPDECQAKLKRLAITYDNPRFEKICGAKYMAPLYDPATQRPEDA